MVRPVYPIICAGMCADEFGQRTTTTSDDTDGWTQTKDRLFSYDGNWVWLCPECVLRWESRLQRMVRS